MNKEGSSTHIRVKKLLRRLARSRFIQLGLTSGAIGFALMAVAEFALDRTEPDLIWLLHLCRDLGIALMVAGTVGIGAELATREEAMELVEDVVRESFQKVVEPKLDELGSLIRSDNFRILGVKDVFPDRSEHSCQRYLDETPPGNEIRLLGISMGYLASRDIQGDIRKKLEAGCTVKLLLLDLNSKYLEKRAIEEARQLENTPEEEQKLIDAFQRDTKLWRPVYEYFAATFPPERFKLRYYDAPPGFFLIDNGVRMLVGFYLRGCSGDRCPHFELTKGGATYEKFSNHFDLLWKWPGELVAASTEEEVLPAPMTLLERRKVSTSVPVERRMQPLVEVSERADLIKAALTPKVSPETDDAGGPM
jgi:hypothetical protein